MTVTDTLHEPVKLARVPWTYLLGIVALAGYFWSSLSSVLTFTILTSASRRKPEAAERLPDFLHWPLAIEATFLLIVTILLVLWITFGLRLQHARPRLALTLVAAAILSHFIMHLPLAYWMFVHGGR